MMEKQQKVVTELKQIALWLKRSRIYTLDGKRRFEGISPGQIERQAFFIKMSSQERQTPEEMAKAAAEKAKAAADAKDRRKEEEGDAKKARVSFRGKSGSEEECGLSRRDWNDRFSGEGEAPRLT